MTLFIAQESTPAGPSDVIGVFTMLERAIEAGKHYLTGVPHGVEVDILQATVDGATPEVVGTLKPDGQFV